MRTKSCWSRLTWTPSTLQGGPPAKAPGADDDGSGSAGVLEMARVFREHRAKHDLRFILFAGEEEGLFGSKHHFAKLSASERARTFTLPIR